MATGSPTRSRDSVTSTTTTTTTTTYFWERRRAGALPWVLGAVGLMGLGLAHDVPMRHTIEKDLETRSAAALADAPGVQVDFTGRDGVLSGTLPPGVDAAALIAEVEAVEGVRVVTADFGGSAGTGGEATPSPSAGATGEVSPSAPAPAASTAGSSPSGAGPSASASAAAALPAVTAVTSGGSVTLSGTVPNEQARQAMVAAATATFGAGKVIDQLTVDPAVSDQGLTGFGTLVGSLGTGSAATAALKDGALTLSGTVADAATKTAAETAAQAVTGDPGAVTSQLVVAGAGSNAGTGSGNAPQQRLNSLPQITFRTGSTQLTPDGLRAVRQAAAVLKANPSVKVRIEGHTDDVGQAATNLRLSTARAERVRQVLHSLGIAHERMSYRGYGEARPKLANSSTANRAVNRRVEFIVL